MQMHPKNIIVQQFHLHLVHYLVCLLMELLDQKCSKPSSLKSIKRKPKRINNFEAGQEKLSMYTANPNPV